ncbi:recombinase family protein [Bacillus benzoevorans]|uniref:DNA invertase Pin-like site-specific DNA recombinase n=1 Tax=Bacillus benzoevorans TaxID=1456 RepID=A0A7X0LWH7_9BACI|nr:recombinase family protein [Bacillus benzoevorans]MBB6447071.1 DNA invertase Pin-like site-specific DNA recombinase [Bacillus benzoevorans]
MKCAAYIRTASKRHVNFNLEDQTEEIKAFISKYNWELDTIYSDIGSGIHKNKSLQAMFEDCKESKFDIIVTADLSRVSRSTELSNELIDLFTMGKVHIVTTDNKINTFRDDISKLIIHSTLCASEFERMGRIIKIGKKSSNKQTLLE